VSLTLNRGPFRTLVHGGVQRADRYVIVHFGTSDCDGHHTESAHPEIRSPVIDITAKIAGRGLNS
jgi:hypothetical protein